jgi:amidase
MSLRPPTRAEIRELGADLYLDLTDEEVEQFRDLVAGSLGMYETIRDLGQPDHDLTPDRELDTGHRARENDPYNAWITRCEIEGDADGPLAGWEVGLKDTVSLAGVEMTCGSRVMEGYTPNVDATVVTRLLDAGATIVGKNNMDDMALGANGSTSAFGPIRNPHDDDHLAGGSSGGGAAAVAAGEVDLAIGGDQGGSVRAPAAWSGVVGFKPTHGLVPYTGIAGLENTIDHVGTFTETVSETARALSVLAGRDGHDPRQPASVPVSKYESALDDPLEDLSVAVVEEGFTREGSEERVNLRVHEALDVLEDGGATVEEVSMPIHEAASDVYTVALMEGALAAFEGEGLGHNWDGWYNVSWLESFGKFRRAQGGDFPPTVKLVLLTAAYTAEQYHSKFYAEAMNLRREITREYESLLESYDIAAMPTTPQTAQEHDPNIDGPEFIFRSWANLPNLSPFNVTGQPALSLPVHESDELPVGIQLVGSRHDDRTVLQAGDSLETALRS